MDDELSRVVANNERVLQVKSLRTELKNIEESLGKMRLNGIKETMAEDEASSIAAGSDKTAWAAIEECLEHAQAVVAELKRGSN